MSMKNALIYVKSNSNTKTPSNKSQKLTKTYFNWLIFKLKWKTFIILFNHKKLISFIHY